MLTDGFNRNHNYLRISLTERCNLRCTYCMPEEGIVLRDRMEFMTQEETLRLAEIFVSLGVTKIRLTGGEPLIKKNFAAILEGLSQLPVELGMTTNGILLDQYWNQLQSAGLRSLNISLDSLQEERMNKISRRNYFHRIYNNVETAIKKEFDVKINCVLMKGENDDEIIDFINLAKDKPVGIRFIEFMPFDGNKWDKSKTVSYREILNKVNAHFGESNITSLTALPNSTSRNFQVEGYKGDFGIISSVTNPFCDSCNRIRLTADGKIKNCLFSNKETDLLTALRKGEDVVPLIIQNVSGKLKERGGLAAFDDPAFAFENRSMVRIGG
jgi:molybdenum cofactor biosynthesis protein A